MIVGGMGFIPERLLMMMMMIYLGGGGRDFFRDLLGNCGYYSGNKPVVKGIGTFLLGGIMCVP